MKRIILTPLFLLLLAPLMGSGQTASSIHENFDVACAAASFPYGAGWMSYNPVSGTSADGGWQCTASNGRGGTPGVQCTDVYSSTYHLDTAYLITPSLNFSVYRGTTLYLDFDAKTDSLVLGAELRVFVQVDTPYSPSGILYDLTDSLTPAFSIADSTGWVTHQINITPLEDSSDLYIVFRYTSTDTTGSLWFLDNINTTTSALQSAQIKKELLPLTVIGNSTSSKIDLSYNVPVVGMYNLSIYDMMGREVHKEALNIDNGKDNYTITGLNLNPGMYLVKLDNGYTYGIAKTIVP